MTANLFLEDNVRSPLERFMILAVAVLLVAAVVALAGCQFVKPKLQTLSDTSSQFHFEVPASWTTTVTPGLITMYGGQDMPAQDAAIGEIPWYFVLAAPQDAPADLTKEVSTLAKKRAESRGWKDIVYGKPVATKLGGVAASEMDLAATDDLGRPFEGKLLLAHLEKYTVLIFAFTRPGAFEKAGFDDLKKRFYWHSALPSKEPTASAESTKTKSGTKKK